MQGTSPLQGEEDADAEQQQQQQLGSERDASPQVPSEDLGEAEEGWEGSDSLDLPAQASERAESTHDIEVCC